MIDWLIEYCFSSRWYIEALILPVNVCKIMSFVRRLWPANRYGYSPCHFCYDTDLRFLRSQSKGHPITSPCTTSKGDWGPILARPPWKYFFIFPEVSRKQTSVVINSIFWTVSSTCTRYERVGRLKICASESECRTMLKCSQSVTLYTFIQIFPILKNRIMDIKIVPPSSKKTSPTLDVVINSVKYLPMYVMTQ